MSIVAEKFPTLPVNPVVVADAVLTVTVAVPDGTRPDPALSFPETLIVAVPKVMVCEGVGLLNVGVALLMVIEALPLVLL